jgi:oxygen-dependent protoporphyrinogen oxidase
MLSQSPELSLVKLLQQCYVSPLCQTSRRCRATRTPCARALHTSTTRRRYVREGEQRKAGGAMRIFEKPEFNNGSISFSPGSKSMSHDSHPAPRNIAVLGGGITGLSTAHYLAQKLPTAMITLYESTGRLGGWMNTKRVNVKNGTVVFEQGPRTIRPSAPAGLVTLELVRPSPLPPPALLTIWNRV